jgi:hypothetical protein
MVKGKRETVLRELVKVNHHRNCLLCHAPAGDAPAGNRSRGTVPVGPVPSPYDPLPPSSSSVYYEERNGTTVASAHITYLRQDFSMLLPVKDAAPWPEMQRFDFLVRTRVLTAGEVRDHRQKKQAGDAPALSVQRLAVLSALQQLTGLDAPPSAEAWRQVLALPAPWQAPPSRVDCRK